jgi:hypothetical protein
LRLQSGHRQRFRSPAAATREFSMNARASHDPQIGGDEEE